MKGQNSNIRVVGDRVYKEARHPMEQQLIEREREMYLYINRHAYGVAPMMYRRYPGPGIEMDYLKGYVHLSDLSSGERSVVMQFVLNKVAELHRAGVIHGDLHADNVMVKDGLLVKLIDFGFSFFSNEEKDRQEDLDQLYTSLRACNRR